MKPILFLSLAIVSRCALAQDLAKKITYECVATPAPKCVADLAKLSGVKLTADPLMSREVLLISVKEVNLSELMTRIAKATSGRWAKTSSGYDLEADNPLREQQAAKELQDKATRIKKFIDAQKSDKVGNPAPTPPDPKTPSKQEEQPPEPMMGQMFGLKLSGPILASMDPFTIARLQKGQRLVYSSSPTATQLPLSGLDSRALEEFIKTHNEQAATMQKAKVDNATGQSPLSQQTESMMSLLGMDSMFKPISAPPAKVLLAIENGGRTGMMSMGAESTTVILRLYDSSGKVLYTESSPLFDFSTMDWPDKPEKPGSANKPTANQTIIYSPASKEFMGYTPNFGQPGTAPKKLTPETEAKLLHPEAFDPLSFAPSDQFLSLAHNRGENIVADLPDSRVNLMEQSITNTAQLYQKITAENSDLAVEDAAGWLQISPKTPENARLGRLDRQALSDFINAAHAKGAPALDDMAQYSLKADEPTFDGPGMIYFSMFAPQVLMGSVMGKNDWETLRFYGLMDGTQKDTLRSGGNVPIQSLSAGQLTVLKTMAFGAGAKLVPHRTGEPPKPSKGMFMDMISTYLPQQQTDYLEEPTEAMPGGLPPSATLSVKFENQTAIQPADTGSPLDMVGSLGIDEYALYTFSMDQMKSAGQGAVIPKMNKIRLGNRSLIHFTFQLTPNVSIQKTLADDTFDKSAAPVSSDALPKDFKDAVDAKIAEMKKMPFPFDFGSMNRQKPPP